MTQLTKNLSEFINEAIVDIATQGDKPKFPTGITMLDKYIWGLHKGQLTVIGARTSQGKTSLAMFFSWALIESSAKITYISLEMSGKDLAKRLISYKTHIDNSVFRKSAQKSDIVVRAEEFNTMVKRIEEDLPIKMADYAGFTTKELWDIAYQDKPDFIIVDHIQMISSRGFNGKLDAIMEYLRVAKVLSTKLDIGFLICSQINRAGAQKDRPGMEDLKFCGALEEMADTVLLGYWPRREDGKASFNDYEIIIEKQRHGPIGLVKVKFSPEFYEFSNIEEKKDG